MVCFHLTLNIRVRLNFKSDTVRSEAGYKVNACWYASVTVVVKEGK